MKGEAELSFRDSQLVQVLRGYVPGTSPARAGSRFCQVQGTFLRTPRRIHARSPWIPVVIMTDWPVLPKLNSAWVRFTVLSSSCPNRLIPVVAGVELIS